MNNPMTYIQNGDYLIPDLKLSQQPEKPLGKYGRMRKTYLKEHQMCIRDRPYSAERRKAASERAKAAGYQPPVRKSSS